MTDLAVQKVSRLAKLALTPQEEQTFQKDLSRILEFVSALSTVSTQDVLPLVNPLAEKIPLRADTLLQDGSVEDVLKNAPSQEQHMFLVPKIVE